MERGISCSIYNCSNVIRTILVALSEKYHSFYISWYNAIAKEKTLLPIASEDYIVSSEGLNDMVNATIWDVVLFAFPKDAEIVASFTTYEDYQNSSCECCLIYYDCGELDVYLKDSELLNNMHKLLVEHNAENFVILTDENDRRDTLHIF